MAKDPAFLFYPGDYLRDTQCLSESAQVAYDRIICEHMRNICIRQHQLNFFTKRLTDDEKEELLMVLDQTDDGYQVPWVVDSILKRRAYSESRRKNRSKGKGKKHKKDMLTYVEHMENENEIEKEKEEEIKEGGVGETIKSMKTLWLAAYKLWSDDSYIWDKDQDWGHMTDIIRFLREKARVGRRVVENEDEVVVTTWEAMLTNMPKWYKDHPQQLASIKKGLNRIYTEVFKNEKSRPKISKELYDKL